MSKSFALWALRSRATLFVALLVTALSMAACGDDAQSVREANQTPALSTSTAETPTPSAKIQVTELEDGDCVNSTLSDGINIDTVVIVPCSGDWQYRVLESFQVASAEAYPDESFFLNQVSRNCDRGTSTFLYPLAGGWEQGDRTITCLQQAPELVISDMLEVWDLDADDLSDDEASCLEEWVPGANLVASFSESDTPALIGDFRGHLERCASNLLGVATATPATEPTAATAPASTPTPEPAPTPEHTTATAPTSTPTPGPIPTTEPVTDASLSAAQVYARVAPSIVLIETPSAKGSGVLIGDGFIVTNRHVVWPYESVWVTFPDGAWYQNVPVIGWDALSDLAVVGPVETSVDPAELADGEGLAAGSELYLIGYPAETEAFPEPTISRGILSRYREWEWFGMTYLQTDASIAGGQSGGALVNNLGQVIGISTFRFSEAGFALATSIADDIAIVDDLILWGWDSADPSRRRLPTGEGDFGYTVDLFDELTTLTFVLDGEAGLAIQVRLDGAGDGAFAVVGPGGLFVEVDEGVTGVENLELELEVDGPHFVTVGMTSEEPQVFELSSNVLLRHLSDSDDEESIQVWEALTGNIDHYLDSDSFWLRLEEGESVAIFAESVSTDTHIVVGLPGLPDTLAFDDDGGGGAFGTDSVLLYRALRAGRYFILVSDSTGANVGGYLLGVEAIDALEIWDDNGDGKITCDEATANNIAPVTVTHPAYTYVDDSDGDGVACR